MAVRIRLSRGGCKKRPFYRIVAADSRSPRDGRFIEKLGTYNPLLPQGHTERLVVNAERVKHWISNGALPTDRLEGLLAGLGLCAAPVRKEQTKQPLPKAKAQARVKEKEAKAEAAIEAAKAAKEAEKAAKEAEKAAAAAAKAAAEAPAPAAEEVAVEAPAE